MPAASTHVRVTAIPSVTDALKAVESLLLGAGQRVPAPAYLLGRNLLGYEGSPHRVVARHAVIGSASVTGRWASSPPSDHPVAGLMLPSVVGIRAATSCGQKGAGGPI